jgi:hypothetical protein
MRHSAVNGRFCLPSLRPLKILHGPLMLLGGSPRRKRPQVLALSSFRIFLARIQTILPGLQFSDHAQKDAARASAVGKNLSEPSLQAVSEIRISE